MASKQWYLQYNTASSKSSLVKWLATRYPCNDDETMAWHNAHHNVHEMTLCDIQLTQDNNIISN